MVDQERVHLAVGLIRETMSGQIDLQKFEGDHADTAIDSLLRAAQQITYQQIISQAQVLFLHRQSVRFMD